MFCWCTGEAKRPALRLPAGMLRHRLREFSWEPQREKPICRAHTRGDFRDFASPISLRHMPSAATSFPLSLNPETRHYANTQPAGVENIWPLSCALGTWSGSTNPLKSPNFTPFINLLPEEPAPRCLGSDLDVTCGNSWGMPRDVRPHGEAFRKPGRWQQGSVTPKTCPGPSYLEHHSC